MELHFVIPGDPKTKKNSQIPIRTKNGRSFIIQSDAYRNYEKKCKSAMPKVDKPISTPVTVKAIFYRDSRRKVDRANLEAALHDILVKYGVLADDNRDIIASGDGTRVYHDKINPRTEVWITDYEGEYDQWKTD